MVKKVETYEQHSDTTRTDVHCHECSKTFIAKIDFQIDGNHTIVCPYCGHEHCRVVKKGVITSDRWNSSNSKSTQATTQKLWSAESKKIQTSTASHFLRERWLNPGQR